MSLKPSFHSIPPSFMHRTQSMKENLSGHQMSRKSSRPHKASRRLADATNDANTATFAKQIQKKAAIQRAKKRAFANNARAVVVEAGDSDEVRQLKARVHRAEAERDAALDRAIHSSGTSEPAQPAPRESESNVTASIIPRPSNLSKVNIGSIRQHLGLEGPENKGEWLNIRNTIRDMMSAVRLDWDLDWKSQKSRKLVKLYDAVEEAIPSLRRFKNQWAVGYLAREAFIAHKTYRSCRNTPTTYRGKQIMTRRAGRETPSIPLSPQPEPPLHGAQLEDSGEEGLRSEHHSSLATEHSANSSLPEVSDLSEISDSDDSDS